MEEKIRKTNEVVRKIDESNNNSQSKNSSIIIFILIMLTIISGLFYYNKAETDGRTTKEKQIEEKINPRGESVEESSPNQEVIDKKIQDSKPAFNNNKIEDGNRPLTGGRSRSSIMKVVMQNLAALRYAYNKRLREKPGLKGRITVKFAIDEFGKIIFCQVVSTTMNDSKLEEIIVGKIKRWVFEEIDKPGDVTEVVYPFVFSQ